MEAEISLLKNKIEKENAPLLGFLKEIYMNKRQTEISAEDFLYLQKNKGLLMSFA